MKIASYLVLLLCFGCVTVPVSSPLVHHFHHLSITPEVRYDQDSLVVCAYTVKNDGLQCESKEHFNEGHPAEPLSMDDYENDIDVGEGQKIHVHGLSLSTVLRTNGVNPNEVQWLACLLNHDTEDRFMLCETTDEYRLQQQHKDDQ